MVNAGLEGFVRAAAPELPRNLCINAVSPPWVKETMVKLGMGRSPSLAAANVAKTYVAAVEGSHYGKVLYPRHVQTSLLPTGAVRPTPAEMALSEPRLSGKRRHDRSAGCL